VAMQISQIFLTDGNSDQLPAFIRLAVATVKKAFRNHEHVMYDKHSLRNFIESNYDAEVLRAYDSLVPYAYKADLGRLCILLKIGGWYFDLPVRVVMQGDVKNDIELIAFRDPSPYSKTSWCCSNAVLYSRPNNQAIEIAIHEILNNCRNKYYGNSPLDPTGPNLFGKSLAMHGPDPKHVYGDVIDLTPHKKNKNRAFVLPEGDIVAWAKPRHLGGGGLAKLGVEGTNNYVEIWNSRQAYTTAD
jgi:hypothetical protein